MEKEKKKLYGIHGWLLFILIIFIFSALNNFINLITKIINPSLPNTISQQIQEQIQPNTIIQTISIILSVVVVTLLILTIYKIIKKKKSAKKIAIITLWALFVVSLYGAIITLVNMPTILNALSQSSQQIRSLYQQTRIVSYVLMAINIIFSLSWAIIWTLYFLKSKRVENTIKEK